MWRHLQSGGKPSFKVHGQTKGLKKKNGNNPREYFKYETDKNRNDFFGHERTQQGLKKVQKGKVWYRKDF